MIFGERPVGEAEGTILAHSVRHDGGTFKKGRVLSRDDIVALGDAGCATVIVAELEAGDVPEDEAARKIADAAGGAHVTVAAPFTGRANIYADDAGVALIDAARLAEINRVDESITIASVPAFDGVTPKQMLATVKIIPFAAPRGAVDEVVELCGRNGIVSVAPYSAHAAGLILTRLPQTTDKMMAKARKVIAERLQAAGSALGEAVECAHETGAIAEAVAAQREAGLSPILILGASAIVDRGDVIPAGVVAAGGEVRHLGMPVDPGNLMMMASVGETPVIGVPSCARSPKLNGFDWVLQRTLAGLDVSSAEIADMGAGGLLKEIPSRPRPRETTAAADVPQAARVTAVVLAAGQSRRMGPANKLLEQIEGEPMVRRVVASLGESHVDDVVVVLGHEADRVRAALDGYDCTFTVNDAYDKGLSTSLRAGLDAVPEESAAALVCLGDMPFVAADHFNRLLSAFDPEAGRGICVPTVSGKRGNPVLWARAYFAEMREIDGDVGARHLLGRYAEDVCEVEIGDQSVVTDIDTPEMLAAVKS